MSKLEFKRDQKKIRLFDADGTEVGSWHAENNVQSGASPWPDGTYTFSWHSPHTGGDEDSAYGSHGNFIFEVPDREGMGVHSGRKNVPDAHGNKGPAHVTDGCIRSTDECTSTIKATHASDALAEIVVG